MSDKYKYNKTDSVKALNGKMFCLQQDQSLENWLQKK